MISLCLVGDIMLGGLFSGNFEKWRDDYIPDEVRPCFKKDFVFANLECPCSNRGEPIPDKILLYSFTEPLVILKELNMRVVSLANNHMMDYGIEAVRDTMDRLEELGIQYTGAGNNIFEAGKPVLLHVRGNTIATLCFSWTSEWTQRTPSATSNDPGINPLKLEHILDSIQTVRQQQKPDLILVSLHWGESKSRYPRATSMVQARAIIEVGADIIVGHHPHCLQGYELYRDKPIFYSLGNFISSQYHKSSDQRLNYEDCGSVRKRHMRERKTLIVNLEIQNRMPIEINFTPLVQQFETPQLVLPDKLIASEILLEFERQSRTISMQGYPLRYPFIRRFDEVERILEDLTEQGFESISWKALFRITRKLFLGKTTN